MATRVQGKQCVNIFYIYIYLCVCACVCVCARVKCVYIQMHLLYSIYSEYVHVYV